MGYHLLLLKAENPEQYKKLANEGILLGYPVKINGQHARPDNGIHYHSSIKFFNKEKDHPHSIHALARHLPLNPPDAKNTQIGFDKFQDRLGNDVHVVTLHGNSAEKIKEHNGKFAHMGYPANFEYKPHVSVDKGTWDKIKSSGAKTAHEAGIEFGPAELKQGPKTLKTYHHQADSAEPKVPDQGDLTAKMNVPKTAMGKSENTLEKGTLNNIGLAAGMAAGLATAAHPINAQDKAPGYDHHKMLNAISQVESSGGKNVNHRALNNGQHAYGKWALTPNTIQDTIKSNPDLKAKYGKALALKGDTVHRFMQDNKGLEDLVADRHLTHLEGHFGGNLNDLGVGWLNGVAGTKKAKKNGKDLSNHWYAKRIKENYGKGK